MHAGSASRGFRTPTPAAERVAELLVAHARVSANNRRIQALREQTSRQQEAINAASSGHADGAGADVSATYDPAAPGVVPGEEALRGIRRRTQAPSSRDLSRRLYGGPGEPKVSSATLLGSEKRARRSQEWPDE